MPEKGRERDATGNFSFLSKLNTQKITSESVSFEKLPFSKEGVNTKQSKLSSP